MSPTRFIGGCEPLAEVDVSSLVDWVSGLTRDNWPDWGKGSDRPAVVVDPEWEGLAARTQAVVSELLKLFPGCSDTYRAITTVHPGDYVPAHTDTQSSDWISRIHVPIVTNPGAVFIINDVEHHLEVGMAYQVNPGKPHAIRNDGHSSRVHLMFDVRHG